MHAGDVAARLAGKFASGVKGGGARGRQAVSRRDSCRHRGRYTERITTQGTLLADETIELQAEVAGRIAAISFAEGARVRKGALLLKLNDADLQAMRTRAIYRKELAVLREQRIAQLLTQGVARREEYDTALNELKIQEAEIALAEAQIAKTEIRAPFDGAWACAMSARVRFVNAATRVATLQRIDRVKVDFAVPEQLCRSHPLGSPIAFTIAGASGQHRAASSMRSIREIDVATRTVAARAVGTNIEGRLLPAVSPGRRGPRRYQDAIAHSGASGRRRRQRARTCSSSRSARAVRRSIEAGHATESKVHILSGLQAGDVVITSGHATVARRRRSSTHRRADRQRGQGVNVQGAGLVTLAEVSIRRPVLTIVISLLDHAARSRRAVAPGRARVSGGRSADDCRSSTSYPGAAAEVVQAQITEPIEEAINAVAGIANAHVDQPRGRQPDLRGVFARHGSRHRSERRSRSAGARGPQSASGRESAHPEQGACGFQSDLRPCCEQCRAHAARAQRLRGCAARTVADRARHRRSRSACGEALCDAPVDGSGKARGLSA